MRLLADMPISPRTVDYLNGLGHDTIHAMALGLARAPDAQILAWAGREHRVVLSEDLDFGALLALSGATGPGVILLRVGPWHTAAINERLGKVLRQHAARMEQAITIVERSCVRIHRLPVGRHPDETQETSQGS